jgi:hypothetical protein
VSFGGSEPSGSASSEARLGGRALAFQRENRRDRLRLSKCVAVAIWRKGDKRGASDYVHPVADASAGRCLSRRSRTATRRAARRAARRPAPRGPFGNVLGSLRRS